MSNNNQNSGSASNKGGLFSPPQQAPANGWQPGKAPAPVFPAKQK